MADIFWVKGHQFDDDNGNPLAGGKLYVFDAGTTSERTAYKDAAEGTPWTQPIVLDSAGRLTSSVYVPEGSWKFLLTDASDVTITTDDDIPGAVAESSAVFAKPQRDTLTKAANYTLTSNDLGKLILADATGGAFTLTLPSAVDVADGKGYDVLAIGSSGAVTIDGDGSETINGAATVVLSAYLSAIRLTSDGANWRGELNRIPATSPASQTSAFTVASADEGRLFLCDTTSTAFTATLLAAATAGNGFRVGFKKTNSGISNALTIDGDGSETIDGATTYTILGQYEAIWLRSDGTSWHIENPPRFNDLFVNDDITSLGDVTIKSPSSSVGAVSVAQAGNAPVLFAEAQGASYDDQILRLFAYRSANSAFDFWRGTSDSDGTPDVESRAVGSGDVVCDGSFTGGGADFAEMFEWADGNPLGEDRTGYTVVVEGDKVAIATAAHDPNAIVGAVSAKPTIIGNNPQNWPKKRVLDAQGKKVMEPFVQRQVEVFDRKRGWIGYWLAADVIPDTDGLFDHAERVFRTVPKAATRTHDGDGERLMRPVVSAAFNREQKYVPRSERPEWAKVGFVGRIPIRDTEPVNPRWVRLKALPNGFTEYLVR